MGGEGLRPFGLSQAALHLHMYAHVPRPGPSHLELVLVSLSLAFFPVPLPHSGSSLAVSPGLRSAACLALWSPCGSATFLLCPEATEVLWAGALSGSVFECVCTDRWRASA